MTFTFENDSEAFLSVITLVIGADQAGSLSERSFLFNDVRALPVFGGASEDDFGTLLAKVTDSVYSTLPSADGAITSDGVDSLLADVKAALDPGLHGVLVDTVEKLCAADGTSDGENDVLRQIRAALG